jgi:hypothetical protein
MARFLTGHVASAFELHPGQRARLLREQAVGPVIPDLLFGIWSGELPSYARLNAVSRHILAWLSARKTAASQDQLCECLFLSHHASTSAISTLERIGALSKRASGELELCPQFDVPDNFRLIAIEMKLKRWREALAQAIQYRKFADEAYVVLDGNRVDIGDQIRDTFATNGIGLFVSLAGTVWKEIPAAQSAPEPCEERLFALSKFANGPYCLA